MSQPYTFVSQYGLRGTRDYVQGSLIWDHLHEVCGQRDGSAVRRIRFNARLASQCEITVFDPAEPPTGLPGASEASFEGELFPDALGTARRFVGRPLPAQLTTRLPAVEPLVAPDAFSGATVVVADPTDFTLIEELVAANKELCQRCSPVPGVRWLFVALTVASPLPRVRPPGSLLTVRLVNMLGSRFAESTVQVGERALGVIRFAARPT